MILIQIVNASTIAERGYFGIQQNVWRGGIVRTCCNLYGSTFR
jgi:hypothetical protein